MVRGAAAARDTSDEAGASVLGRGARVRGRIGGDGDLRIEGQVEGDVAISGELTIEEGASVTGDVGAGAVVVGGALRGDVDRARRRRRPRHRPGRRATSAAPRSASTRAPRSTAASTPSSTCPPSWGAHDGGSPRATRPPAPDGR